MAGTTTLMWGFLPMAAQPILQVMNPQTLVTTRFAFAALFLFAFLSYRQQLPARTEIFCVQRLGLLALGVLGLFGNFFLFSKVLLYLSPAAAQVMAQLQPFLLMFASVLLFKESLKRLQIIAAILLITGILLFFNRELPQLFASSMRNQLMGILLGIIASAVWVIYSLVQKQLNRSLSNAQILSLIYLGCALLGFPFMDWTAFERLSPQHWLLLLFCCLNTPIAYGAFAEAIRVWQISKVSATLTLVPLVTIISTELLHLFAPQRFPAPQLNLLAYIGAATVMSGALLSVSAKSR